MNQIFEQFLDVGYKEIKGLKELIEHYNIRETLLIKSRQIRKDKLYPTMFHGLHHSQKVFLFAYLIACEMNISDEEKQILTDAAFYHDIGRQTENEESIHGYVSANKIESLLNDQVYNNKTNIGYLKAIIDVHSQVSDNAMANTFENYKLYYPDMDYTVFERLANILMDADALDRTRFKRTCEAALKEKYLRLDLSRKLVVIAQLVNDFFYKSIDEINITRISQMIDGDPPEEKMFFHGIGWDFFAFDNILSFGILSSYESRQNNVKTTSNFNNNNNGSMWISVADASIKDGQSYSKFIQNNLALLVCSSEWFDGLNTNKAHTKDLGLSFKSKDYDDEKFIFKKVDPSRICQIIIPNKGLLPLCELDYLNCSYNIDIVKNKILHYVNSLERYCGYSANLAECSSLIYLYQKEIIDYEKMAFINQRKYQSQFLAKGNEIISSINKILQRWISEGFSRKLNIPAHSVKAIDVINYILLEHNIEYFINEEGSLVISDNNRKEPTKNSTQR